MPQSQVLRFRQTESNSLVSRGNSQKTPDVLQNVSRRLGSNFESSVRKSDFIFRNRLKSMWNLATLARTHLFQNETAPEIDRCIVRNISTMNTGLFFSTFALIFVAELPDKTALAAVLLATRGNPFAVFCGAALAFTIQSAVSVAFGSVLGFLPPRVVHVASASLFLLFSLLMWRRTDSEEDTKTSAEPTVAFLKTAWSSFVVIFLAEWGDLTQLATAALAAKYRSPITLFSAATLALWASSGIAIAVGYRLKHLIRPSTLRKIAALAFLLVALWMFITEARAGC